MFQTNVPRRVDIKLFCVVVYYYTVAAQQHYMLFSIYSLLRAATHILVDMSDL